MIILEIPQEKMLFYSRDEFLKKKIMKELNNYYFNNLSIIYDEEELVFCDFLQNIIGFKILFLFQFLVFMLQLGF